MIHYHGLPMTPAIDMVKAMRSRHAMVSFEDYRQIEDAAEVCQSVVLDNGAFSAWRAGKRYDFSGYRIWAAHWLKHPAVEWAIIPDVIDGDHEQNAELVRQWDLNPAMSVPVYHLHEPLSYLQWLMAEFPRIALGSSGQYADPGARAWWDRMAEIMGIVCDEEGHPKVKLHGLRMLDPVLFSHLPLTSADSCNVARNIGIDGAWKGTYTPRSKWVRALVMMDRIEHHASARRWNGEGAGVQQNMELLG